MTLSQWFEREGLTEASASAKARRLNLKRTTMWRILKGLARPDVDTIQTITRATKGLVRFEDFT